MSEFRDRYGPFALVVGASTGLGEAFARALASRGLHLLLLARRQEALDVLATVGRTLAGMQAPNPV